MNKKYKNILKNDFKVGFEVEIIFDADKISFHELENIFKKLDSFIYCDEDTSLEGSGNYENEEVMEIKTPALTPVESLFLLQKVFKIVNKYGYTNQTCGFHASFSPVSDEDYYKINPFYLINQPLWSKIKKDFKREDNHFCVTPSFKFGPNCNSPIRLWQSIINGESFSSNDLDYEDHCYAINFENLHTERNEDSRIEVRAFGNTNYHKKYSLITKYVDRIIWVIKKSFSQPIIAT